MMNIEAIRDGLEQACSDIAEARAGICENCGEDVPLHLHRAERELEAIMNALDAREKPATADLGLCLFCGQRLVPDALRPHVCTPMGARVAEMAGRGGGE